jgi:hypothetical protein
VKLYEIEQAILDCIDEDTGEVIDLERLNQLSIDRQIKIDNIACWYKQLVAEAVAIENEIKILSERKDSKKGKAENLKYFLSDILYGAKFESSRNRITWRQSDEVRILDETVIPDKYKTEKIEVNISKTDIKKAIKNGLAISGAELIYKNNIQIK